MKKVILVIGFVMCLLLVQAQTRRQMGGVYCAYPFTEVETGKTLSIEKYEDEDNAVTEVTLLSISVIMVVMVPAGCPMMTAIPG